MLPENVHAIELSAWSHHDGDEALDYAIVKIDKPLERIPLTLAPSSLKNLYNAQHPVNIIQHPAGQPKMLSIRNNRVHELTEWELSYFTDTESGSSGSPVCNDNWQVVALHRRWHKLPNRDVSYQGKQTDWDNRGTRIDRIIEDVKQNYPALLQELDAKIIS